MHVTRRMACARFLIINAVEFPAALAGMALAERAVLHLQIPLGTLPCIFVPPISRGPIRPFLPKNFSLNFRAAQMGWTISHQQHRSRHRGAKSPQGASR